MLSLRRKAVQTAPRLRALYSTEPPKGHHDEHHGSDHGHDHHPAPEPESLGTQFFVVLGALPLAIGLYTISRPNEHGERPLTRFINSYSSYKEIWATRNALHTEAIERAAFDRNLFQSHPGTKHIELRFPETFNMGSPHNVVAGSGSRGMDELVKHYEKERREVNERRADKLAAKKES